ncbi:MAG TPA: hypothetical protein VIU15_27765 [Streptomyces sp.]
MITIEEITYRVAAILAGNWKSEVGCWGVHSNLASDDSDETYTLCAEDHRYLVVEAVWRSMEIARFRPHDAQNKEYVIQGIVDAIRAHEAKAAEGDEWMEVEEPEASDTASGARLRTEADSAVRPAAQALTFPGRDGIRTGSPLPSMLTGSPDQPNVLPAHTESSGTVGEEAPHGPQEPSRSTVHACAVRNSGNSSLPPSRQLNMKAHFTGADYDDPATPHHPTLTNAGIIVSTYIDDAGTCQIVVDLDEAITAVSGSDNETAVPIRITMQGGVLFSSTGIWIIRFRHPDDRGDNGVWEFTVPAQEAQTEETARAAATQQFTAEISSHENPEIWDGATIVSVRLTDHPPVA